MTAHDFALESIRLRRPPRKAACGGEWDWWWQLPAGKRLALYRHMDPLGAEPDLLATWTGHGTDVDGACLAWVSAIDAARPVVVLERPCETVALSELLGPAELAELLGVTPATVRQWRRRRILPVALLTLSGVELWERATVVAWAEATGRWELPGEAASF